MSQLILDRLVATFTGGEIEQIGSQHGNEWARVRRDAWRTVATFLRDDPACDMKMPTDLTAVDRMTREPRFDVVAHLYSVTKKHRVRLYAGVPEDDCTLDSLVPVYPGLDWFEREAYDLYGVRFRGPPRPAPHPDVPRVRRPPAAQGLPQREAPAAHQAQRLPREARVTPRVRRLRRRSRRGPQASRQKPKSHGHDAHPRFSSR